MEGLRSAPARRSLGSEPAFTPMRTAVLSERGPSRWAPSRVLVLEAACETERVMELVSVGSKVAEAALKVSFALSVEMAWI